MTFEEEFARVWPWLEKSILRYGDTHRKEHVYQRLLEHKAQLWTEKDAAVITSLEEYDTGFLEVQGWLAGGSIGGVKKIEHRIEQWARQIGAHRMTLVGRKGWQRALPGYHELFTTIAKDLQHG
jgi:hypothetical protein